MQISSRASFPEGEIVVTRNPYKANWQAMQARGTCIEDLFIYWRSWSCHRLLHYSTTSGSLYWKQMPQTGHREGSCPSTMTTDYSDRRHTFRPSTWRQNANMRFTTRNC